MALQDTLNTKLPALLQGFDTATDKADFARKELGGAKKDFMAAEEEAALGEASMKRGVQEKEFKTQEEFAKKEREVVKEYQGMRQEQAPFDATQFQLTPEQAAADSLKMLIGGLLFGGIAKTSAGVALDATLKMREARDKNLQNDYNIALQQYEQADKRIREHNKNLLDEMTRALQLLSTDKAAALSKAKMVEAQIEDGVIKSKLRAGNWKSVIDDMQKVVTEDDKRKAEKEKLEFQRQTQIDVANIRATAKDEAKQEKPVKISSTLEKSLRQGNELLSRLQQLKDTAKEEYFALAPSDTIASLRLGAQEMGLSQIANMLGKPVNDEAVLWWKNYNDLISEERKERFGATLTGNEKQSFRETIVAPSSTYRIGMGVLDRKIQNATVGVAKDFKQLAALGAPQSQIDSYLPDVDTQRFAATKPTTKQSPDTIYTPKTEEEYAKVPSGAIFIDPDDGKKYRKP